MGTTDKPAEPVASNRGDAHSARAARGGDEQGAASAEAGHRVPPAGAEPHVLLAEDDAALRRYLEVVLRRAGYRVTAAADGLEALRLALAAHFDAVVTDAVMPRLGGRELCRMLRARDELASLPVVMLTGLGASDDGAQADARLSKPVEAEELLACLARLLGPRP